MFKSFFYVSKKDRLGIIGLFIMVLMVWTAPWIYTMITGNRMTDDLQVFKTTAEENGSASAGYSSRSYDDNPPVVEYFKFDPNTAPFQDFVRLGLPRKTAYSIIHYREKGGRFKYRSDMQKIYNLNINDYERLKDYIKLPEIPSRDPIILSDFMQSPDKKSTGDPFPFDPNTATKEVFMQLGLSAKTAASIINYRNKGGVFRTPEDFRKIYTLSPEDFERLKPFINIELAGDNAAFPKNEFQIRKTCVPTDINKATADDWQKLPGIGKSYAQRIVKFRDALGGFFQVNQVAEVYNLPDSVFRKIKDCLNINSGSAVKTISINKASAEELSKHPYLNKKQAAEIVRYRSQHGDYKSVEEILILFSIAPLKDTFYKIKPYLSL